MGEFSTLKDTSITTTKWKIVEVRETHGVPLKAAKKRPLLGFTDNEKVNGVSNEELPLVIVVAIQDHGIARCLVNEGSSVNILYQDAFEKLGLKEENLKPYEDTDLHSFNKTSTRPWGYVTLSVTFREEMDERTFETLFLVVLVVSIYNCILGRPTLAALDAVTSMVHLKMKCHNRNGDVATIYAHLKAAEARCHKTWGKLPAPQSSSILEGGGRNLWRPVPSSSNADFDDRQEKKIPKRQKRARDAFPFGSKTKRASHEIKCISAAWTKCSGNPS